MNPERHGGENQGPSVETAYKRKYEVLKKNSFMLDAINSAAACPLIKADYEFGVICYT